MPKWTPDDHGCIYDEAGCFARLTPNKAERLATRHNADIDALTAERDSAIDEKLFWVDKYVHEMERADRRCDQWQRCFRLAFELKSRYFNQLRVMTAEREELQNALAFEVADNVRLRSRHTGYVEGNLHQEICELNNRITELESTLTLLRDSVPPDDPDSYEGRSYAVYSQWLSEIASILYPPETSHDA